MKNIKKSDAVRMVTRLLQCLGIAVGIVLMLTFLTPVVSTSFIVDEALAAGPGTSDGKGKMTQGGQGGQSSKTGRSQGDRKGVEASIFAEEEDDDSDRPDWAGGDPELNPHSGSGGGKPDGAGTMKGDDYGDLWVVVRDLETGEPDLDINGNVQPIVSWPYVQATDADGNPVFDESGYPVFVQQTDVDGNPVVDENGNPVYEEGLTTLIVQLSADGEVPHEFEPYLQEVEFGRAAVARSPDKVSDKALVDALTKLTAEGVVLSTDEAGRISYTVDGVTSTIDSPLENLALYIDLVTGLADDKVTSLAEAALGELAIMETAASLLAGVADKTGNISLDYVVYNNVITGVVTSGEYYDYSDFTYTRDYATDYTYFYTIDGVNVLNATLNINEYLADETINGTLTTDGGATLFAAAADDAVEVIELIHTQIHDGELPGTVP